MSSTVDAKGILRSFGIFLLNSLFALLGPTIVENAFDRVIRFQSGSDMILRSWIFSILCAALTAFFLYRAYRNNTAKWVWILPTLWFVLAVFALGRSYGHSVFGETLWAHISGISCGNALDRKACRDFFAFTIPGVRAISYSAGALISSQIYKRSMAPTSNRHVSSSNSGAEGNGG